MEGLHGHVDLNNPLVLGEICKRKKFIGDGHFHLDRCEFLL